MITVIMKINKKQSKFYQVYFEGATESQQYQMSEEDMEEYKQLARMNPSWGKELKVKNLEKITTTSFHSSFKLQDNTHKQIIDQILYFYQEHNIDAAFSHVIKLRNLDPSTFQTSQHKPLFDQIEREFKDVLTFSKPIQQPGWVLKDEEKNVKLFTKNVNQELCVLIESPVTVPVEIFLQAMVELDLFNKIIPMVEYSKEERAVARNMKIGNFIVDIPILSSREAFYQGIGYDRLNTNGTIFLYIRSIHNQPHLLRQLNFQPKFHPKTVPLDFKFIGLQYTPTTSNTGVCRLCLNINLNMKIIPNWILQKILRTFSFKIFDNIMKVSNNFKGSEWEKRAIQNPILFNFFKQKAREYYGGEGQ